MKYKAEHKTAKQMALQSHNLSKDAMTARTADGKVWKWSDHFQVWAGPFPVEQDSPKQPK